MVDLWEGDYIYIFLGQGFQPAGVFSARISFVDFWGCDQVGLTLMKYTQVESFYITIFPF